MPPRQVLRQRRSEVLWVLVGFVGLQLGLALAVERWLPQLRDPYYAFRAARLHRRLESPDRPLAVVMLGSSRTNNGLIGGLLEGRLAGELGRSVVVFNFGIPAAGPVTNLVHLNRLLAEGIRPDLLLIEVVPMFLGAGNRRSPEANWLLAGRLYLREVAPLERFGLPAAELRREWWRSWPLPWLSRREAILSRLEPRLLPAHLRLDWAANLDDSGWSPPIITSATPEQRRLHIDKLRAKMALQLERLELCEGSAHALREQLDRCRREGIAAALVLMPEGPAYRGWYRPEAWAALRAFVDELCHAYAVPLIDAREWIGEDGFWDSHHLLPHGARAFTERLGQTALLPLLRAYLDSPATTPDPVDPGI